MRYPIEQQKARVAVVPWLIPSQSGTTVQPRSCGADDLDLGMGPTDNWWR